MKNRRPLAQALCMAAGLAANAYAEPVKQPFHVGMDARAFLSYGAYPHPGSGVTMGENLGFLLAVPASFHRVEAKVSVGGFFHLLPAAMSNPGATNWHGYRNGGIQLDELYLRIPFRPFDFGSSLTAGSFRWKSNPDAVRAGEYLTRYAAYPTAPVREAMPWDPADSLSVPVLGMKLAVATPGGRWSQNALVLVEPPGRGRDVSLAYTLDVTPIRGLELGLASEAYRFGSAFGSSAGAMPAGDRTGNVFVEVDTLGAADTVIISRRALLLSMRTALDLKTMISKAENPGRAWRVFAEAAVLGWRNQSPVFERRRDRFAWMTGVHLPSFDYLDVFCLQWEAYPAAWQGSPLAYFRPADSPSWLPGTAKSENPETATRRIHLLASKQINPWIGVQARLNKEQATPSDTLVYGGANTVDQSGFEYELRLFGRF